MSTSLSAAALETWPDHALAALLHARPDLLSPLPGTLTSLAARAATERSARLAVARLDTPTLAVLDAVVALDALEGDVTAERVSTASGLAVDVVDAALAHLAARALVVARPGAGAPAATAPATWRPSAGVPQARAPFPAGLAVGHVPTATSATPATPATPDGEPAVGPSARLLLDRLAWDGPVGTLPEAGSAAADAVRELLAAGLVVPQGAEAVLVPGAVALAARGGRTHRGVPGAPPLPSAHVIDPDSVTAEAGRAALDLARHLADLLEAWSEHPAPALRSGGVGIREMRRTRLALDVPEERANLLVELAAATGAVGRLVELEGTFWVPVATHERPQLSAGAADARGGDGVGGPERAVDPAVAWAEAVLAWWASLRAFALVGTTAPDGARRAPLEPGLDRGWASDLRARVLAALAAWPAGAAPDAEAVVAHVAWSTPAAPPPVWAVASVLAEAEVLGLTGAGALAGTGRALLAVGPPSADDPEAALGALADALRNLLPPPVEEMLVQADLTAVVPGRPAPELAALLDASAETESRGGALTVRFTTASLARAIAAGHDAEDLLARLAAFSRTPLPQPLEYAVREAQRRHGGLRAGSAAAYLRAEDPTVLAVLLGEPGLGLRLIAPTVAVSPVPAGRLAQLLRALGRPVLVEGPDGDVVDVAGRPRASRPVAGLVVEHGPVRGAREVRGSPEVHDGERDLAEAVARLRHGQARASAGERDAADLLGRLREAARAGAEVMLAVAGPSGRVGHRRVIPLRVRDGVVIARDLARETDLTVAVHRVVAVEPVPPAG